jgi:hypothetical protein
MRKSEGRSERGEGEVLEAEISGGPSLSCPTTFVQLNGMSFYGTVETDWK